METGVVMVFDFDLTIIDVDSDNLVVDGLGVAGKFEEWVHAMPWNALMNKLMGELHERGKTIEDIASCLKTAPLHPEITSVIKAAHSLGCDLRIISDANTFFIETILKHHGLFDLFTEINTNPACVDDNGRLQILPYHNYHVSSHGCALCPPNLCKGLIFERIRTSVTKDSTLEKRFIYVVNGRGDFCPSLKLRDCDAVVPRKDYPLWTLIQKNPLPHRAAVHPWSTATELKEALIQLLDNISSSNSLNSNLQCQCVVPSHLEERVLQPFLPVSH